MSSPIRRPPQTPSDAPLIRPPKSEMHPAKYHNGTMPAPSSALRLGFTDIKTKSTATPGAGAQQDTPSRSKNPSSPSAFSFNTTTTADATLGPEALRMMNEIRDQAAKIKADLVAKRDQERQEEEQVNGRKIAHPKGKAGRYSAVHMSEFKKMDSIENHPSAFRAAQGAQGRIAPPTASTVTAGGLKRTQSKANLHDYEAPRTKTAAQIPSSKVPKNIQTPTKYTDSPAKRSRQHLDDDASTNRPLSRDGSNIPRPKTPGKDSRGLARPKNLENLMSPTQASLARSAAARTPTTTARSLLRSPSKINLTGLKKSATTAKLGSKDLEMDDNPSKMRSTSLSDDVQSIFGKHNSTAPASKLSIPRPVAAASKTPAPARVQNELPSAPFATTPGNRFAQRGQFTPAPKHAALAQNSPSPVKSAIPRSKAANSQVNYPSLDAMMEGSTSVDAVIEGGAGDTVSYPDLSGGRPLPPLPAQTDALNAVEQKEKASPAKHILPPAVPGTFTFRSDHTIRFEIDSPKGFGGHSGQASVRQVRDSIMSPMPGAFPVANLPKTTGPRGKENVAPHRSQQSFDPKTFAHGVSSKKRHRVEDDEEEAEREAAERAAKKAKSAKIPEGDALVAPRIANLRKPNGIRSPSKIMKRSPIKSKTPAAAAKPSIRQITPSISKGRLAYLAQPKQRK
ncbi:unnamed protein product [Discula destructiva]